MPANIGIPGLILILIIALIIFGPKKLPQMGKAVGDTLKEFKKSTKDLTKEEDDDVDENKSSSDSDDKNKNNIDNTNHR